MGSLATRPPRAAEPVRAEGRCSHTTEREALGSPQAVPLLNPLCLFSIYTPILKMWKPRPG